MRVLQLCTDFVPGGIQRHVLDLTEGLRARGQDVMLAGTPGGWVSTATDPAFFPIDVTNVSDYGGALHRRLWTALKSGLALRKVIKRERIKLVHAHESAPALVARVATIGLNVPVIVTFHGAEPKRIAEFGRIARLSADLLVTPSYNSARDLVEQGGITGERVRVMGLGVRQAPKPAAGKVEAMRRDLLGAAGTRLVVTVARLTHQKGIDHLISAAAQALKTDPGLRFVVVGDGPQRDDARRWLAESGAGDAIRFIGHRDEAPLYMAAADLFFLSSRWESLPITIVEAFQQGTPVLATDTAGVVELVDDRVGAVVPVGDTDAMAHQLIALTRDKAKLQVLSAAALARAQEERFSPPHVHATFEALYAEMLAQERGQNP